MRTRWSGSFRTPSSIPIAALVNTPSGPAWRLSFMPNEKFIPPDREAQVYHGMAGELWIDCAQKRMSRLDAHLIAAT